MEKLNCKSLMIGDLVLYGQCFAIIKELCNGYVTILCSINGQNEYVKVTYDNIEPIPLTKEILERIGFGSLTDEMFSACETETYSNQELKIYLSHIGCEYNPVQLVVYMGYEPQERVVLRMMPCQYVHELQHALRLCKIEKEIEL